MGMLQSLQNGNTLGQRVKGFHRLAELHLAIDQFRVPTPITMQGESVPHVQGQESLGHFNRSISRHAVEEWQAQGHPASAPKKCTAINVHSLGHQRQSAYLPILAQRSFLSL
jgi:hypothetical protein